MTAPTGRRRLILLRHGETAYNAENRMQGHLDTPLTDRGRAQAVAAAAVVADRKPGLVVSSDLRRAYDTAVTVADVAGLPVERDERLRETHLGEWQGLTHSQVDRRYPGARAAWAADPTVAPPGGESRVDVARRSVAVIDDLLARDPEFGLRPALVVAHGGLIAALTAALLDLPVDRWTVFTGLGNASWVELFGDPAVADGDADPRPRWRVHVWNATAGEGSPDAR